MLKKEFESKYQASSFIFGHSSIFYDDLDEFAPNSDIVMNYFSEPVKQKYWKYWKVHYVIYKAEKQKVCYFVQANGIASAKRFIFIVINSDIFIKNMKC